MSRNQGKALWRISVAALLLLVLGIVDHVLDWQPMVALPIFLLPYFLIGYDVLWKSVRNILDGQWFDENFLMSIATVGALATGQFEEAVFVMLFDQIGDFFETWAVNKSRKSISDLMDIRPDYANVEHEGELVQVDPYEVEAGQVIVVKPGEKIPLDGVIIEGNTSINTVALTGEAIPKDAGVNEPVISGCVNLNGLIRMRVTSGFEDSTVSKILELIEDSSMNKAHSEGFITKFARYYTPLVVVAALLLAFVPPIFGGGLKDWVVRSLTFLVISCPCALVISVPLSFFGGIGAASRRGILVKGSCFLEDMAKCEIAVFDKTGTLTEGTFRVTDLHPEGMSSEKFLEVSALVEAYSDHPIAKSVRGCWGNELDLSRVSDVKEIAGFGITAQVDGKEIAVGNDKLMRRLAVPFQDRRQSGTVLHVAVEGKYAGHLIISDTIRKNSESAIETLQAGGCRTVMLTGDKQLAADEVARKIGIDEVHAELLPGDKVNQVEKLIQKKSPKGKLLFVGDGMNDAPVLARADVGIAMGGIGSDASIEAADIVIMDDDIGKLGKTMSISRQTLAIVQQNIVFAIGIKMLFLALGALGFANMWMAVFADVGVSVLAILNAMRTLRIQA